MELVERAEQLRTLRSAFESAAQGHGRTVLVSGEAGIGKTSLLRSFLTEVSVVRFAHRQGRDAEQLPPAATRHSPGPAGDP